ncbi:MAG TPA: AvrD family protein [Pseudonocardiaceae bacterium]|nr:AvrD family protein [Pseudonocardiaceae bacterium]
MDSTLIMAQVAQALLYQLDGLHRSESNTLWMRRIDMSTTRPDHPFTEPVEVSTRVVRTRLLNFAGGVWRVADLTGDCQGIQVTYSLAHELPGTRERQA